MRRAVLTLDKFKEYRERVKQTDEGRRLVDWARNIRRPTDAKELAQISVGVILSSGFSYETARRFVDDVMEALARGQQVEGVFPHPRKAQAIQYLWRHRSELFETLPDTGSKVDGFRWCSSIPFIRGPVLRYQAVRDLGLADVAKPDRLMVRVARKFAEMGKTDEEAVQNMCVRLAGESRERVGTIDVILWSAASHDFIKGIRLRRRPACHGVPLRGNHHKPRGS
jgi:hypothetical protein